MAAARVAWGLMVAGVARISLLDGGIDAWVRSGGATVRQIANVGERPVAGDGVTLVRPVDPDMGGGVGGSLWEPFSALVNEYGLRIGWRGCNHAAAVKMTLNLSMVVLELPSSCV